MADNIIIVLGQYLLDDGTLSLQCRERCYHAFNLYKENKGNKFLLSGGVANKKAKISESEAMQNYLVSLGVLPKDIIMEKQSKNTYENAKFCAEILSKLQYNKLILVSSSYHIYRWYFNPVRFFKWIFHLKVKPDSCIDSLIVMLNGFDKEKPSVFALVKSDKNLKEFLENNQDKNVFVKTVNSSIKKGFLMKKIKPQDIDMLANLIKNLYQLDDIKVLRL
ncbi:MAG: YdcF family protein [Clostridiales bacterium]|jgi:hypothetical protein|nr:YdcF family protein [Clostridiales bacterium]